MDTNLLGIDDDSGRSSSESSSGFGFTTLELRKNLTLAFDAQALTAKKARRKQQEQRHYQRTAQKPSYAKLSVASCDTEDLESSLPTKDMPGNVPFPSAGPTNSKPPRPVNRKMAAKTASGDNSIPGGSVSVYLRMRPQTNPDSGGSTGKGSAASASAPKSTATTGSSPHSTIEIIATDEGGNPRPTKVRTYPPPQSNTTKINSHRTTNADNQAAYAREFEFHQVLEPETTQKSAYGTIAAPLIDGLFADLSKPAKMDRRGNRSHCESALLFAYGITNAGKTHTIVGDIKAKTDARWGIVPRAIADSLDRIQQLSNDGRHYDLYMSYFEIYNEQVHDLLPKKKQTFMGPPPSLKIRERSGQTVVKGLARYQVRDITHGVELVAKANGRRQTASNNLNSGSSRSHSICQLQLVPRAMIPGTSTQMQAKASDESSVDTAGYNTEEEMSFQSKTSTLWIVDLAGSERSKRTGLVSTQQKEASMINKSLMTLTRCLSLLKDGNKVSRSSNIIPYRESKLTHLFMGHLSGPCAARTSMVVNVNPSVDDFDETQHVLAYASQARTIQVDPEQFKAKRKMFAEHASYDLNGRKKKTKKKANPPRKVRGLLSKVVKKLTPRKAMKSFRKNKVEKSRTNADAAVVTKSNTNGNGNKRKATNMNAASVHGNKRACVMDDTAQAHDSDAEECDEVQVKEHSEKMERLQQSLCEAKKEINDLQSQKFQLLNELNDQEMRVRLEVADEMEEQIQSIRTEYDDLIEQLRAQIQTHPTNCRSMQKVRRDKAEVQIEQLLDRIDECEEEMVRMRQSHADEVKGLQSKIDSLATATVSTSSTDASSSDEVAALKKELAQSRKQVESLKRSKQEIIESYEQLMNEGDEEEEEAAEPKRKRIQQNEDEENGRGSRSNGGRSRKGKQRENNKAPLQVLSNNVGVPEDPTDALMEKSGDDPQWLFPKIPSMQDGNSGKYKRPVGRAPLGREWDGSVGAWRKYRKTAFGSA